VDPFIIKQGDTQPSLAATLSDDNGAIVIPGGATVSFVMRKAADACGCSCEDESAPVRPAVKVSRAAVIVNGAAGQVRYDWAAGDTDEAGDFSGEFKVSVAGAITTYPSSGYIPITITQDLS
jgi:hypothetical protein